MTRELLQPRHDAGRRDLSLRRNQRDLLAAQQTQRARKFATQNDAELALGQLASTVAPRTCDAISETCGSAPARSRAPARHARSRRWSTAPAR